MDKKLAQNAIFNILYKVLNIIFPLITSAYVSRVLLADGIGKAEYARNFAYIFALIASLGLPAYGTKVIASLKNSSNSIDINKNFSELLIILITSSLICFTAYSCIVLSIPKFSVEKPLYFATGIHILLISINTDWLYQGFEEYKYITLRSMIVKVVSLIAILLFVNNKSDIVIYALITSLAIAGNYIFNIINARKLVLFTIRGLKIARHLKPVLILLFSTIAIEMYSKIDILMLGYYCEDSNIGYYSNAVKIINAVLTAVTAITNVYLPRLSLLYKENNNEFKKLANEGTKILLTLTVPCSIGLILISDAFVCTVFGNDFYDSSRTLKILCPLIFIKGVGDLLNYQVVISAGKEKYFLYTNTTAAIINIILNYFFIQILAQNGAAFASVISEIVVNGGMLIISRKIVELKISINYLIKIFFATAIMSGAVIGIRLLYLNTILEILFSVMCGGIVYFIANILFQNEIILRLINVFKNNRQTNM